MQTMPKGNAEEKFSSTFVGKTVSKAQKQELVKAPKQDNGGHSTGLRMQIPPRHKSTSINSSLSPASALSTACCSPRKESFSLQQQKVDEPGKEEITTVFKAVKSEITEA